jgi:hypothetical protein
MMIDFYCWQGAEGSKYCVDYPIIDQIMWNARDDADQGWKPYPKRHSIKGLYGAEGEEIYETAYWAAQGCTEDTELLASKWGYEFGDFGQPTKIEKEAA